MAFLSPFAILRFPCCDQWPLDNLQWSQGHTEIPSCQIVPQGLRTLVLGTKVLSEEEWADWDGRYQDAAAQLDDRDEALAALAVEIEADLEFVGVTAIEDKLQEGVPAAIQSLLDAGMKVTPLSSCVYHAAVKCM